MSPLDLFFQQLVNGLTNGASYVLIATGLTLVFGILKIVNFAHGEFYMLGGLGVFLVASITGLPYSVSVVIAVIAVFIIAVAVEWLLFRPLRAQHEFTTLLCSLGLSLLIVNLVEYFVGAAPMYVESPYADESIQFGNVYTTEQKLLIIICGILVLGLLYWFLKHTIYGRMMRATAENREGAALTGINVGAVYTLTFGLACSLAALAGALVGPTTIISPGIGDWATLKAFVVVILGGLGSVPGAVVGGLVLGIVEAFAGNYLTSGFTDVIGYAVIILVLILRPRGFFAIGRSE